MSNVVERGKDRGRFYHITCENKQCQYHVELREGTSWAGLLDISRLEEAVRSGKIDNPIAKNSLKNGAMIKTNAIYVCPCCKEFQNNSICYLEKITETSLDEFHYEISFPFEKPVCEKCNNELIYINELECSKEVKCPKCGGDLKVELGFFD